MQTLPIPVEKSINQRNVASMDKHNIAADIISSKDVGTGDTSQTSKNSYYNKKKPYNPARKRFAIPWVTKFPMALHEEIWSFSQWLSPTTEEQSMRQDVINRLKKVVEKLWPQATVVPYGSFETNLCVPTSDIDVVIFGAQPIDDKNPLAILAEALEQQELASKPPKVIPSAKVPIVKFNDRKSGCLVDISFDITTGITNTKIIKEFLTRYPLLRPLALVIKFYLKQRYLNDTWSGGIGSYTLIMMIISYLQLHTKSKGQFPLSSAAAPNSGESDSKEASGTSVGSSDEAKEDLASLLTGFFELYGAKFDYLTNVISILDGGKYLTKEEKKWVHPDALNALAVEDPQNTNNDVGFACFKINEAKKAFADAYSMLTAPKKYVSESLLGKLVRVPLSLVQQRQRIKASGGRELTDENQAEAGLEPHTDADSEERRLAYNYHHRYKNYAHTNDVWYSRDPSPTSSGTDQAAGAELSTAAQRAPTNGTSSYQPPHRRPQVRAPAPASSTSGSSSTSNSTTSSASSSPTSSTLLSISGPLVVPALGDKPAPNKSGPQRKGSHQPTHSTGRNNAHGTQGQPAPRSNSSSAGHTASHSPASTSPRVTSSNSPSNTPVHSGHGNATTSHGNARQNNRTGSAANARPNNNNARNNNRGRVNNSSHSGSNNSNHTVNAHDEDIKNDEQNFPSLGKDPTVHENKIAQKASDATNRSQNVDSISLNGNNGAGQPTGNKAATESKKNKRRQNTVLISA